MDMDDLGRCFYRASVEYGSTRWTGDNDRPNMANGGAKPT